jgi:Uma2 family endonuclease
MDQCAPEFYADGVVLRMPWSESQGKGDEFARLCAENRKANLELNADGSMLVMHLRWAITSARNVQLCGQLWEWDKEEELGVSFPSCVAFTLPNGAVRSPDAAWIEKSRWEGLSEADQERFPPIAPDFVVELMQSSDDSFRLREKMNEYIANGVRLGWLIEPDEKWIDVYRPNQEIVRIEGAQSIHGDPVLPGFVLELAKIWRE